MAYDLVVRGGTVVLAQDRQPCDLLVRGGKVEAVTVPGGADGVQVAETVDARGMLIFPGMVDLHVHIGEPGKTEKEDINTGTRAAAAGGVTTAVIMPNCIPAVNSAETLVQRAQLFQEKSFVDFALLGGAGGESVDTIAEQADAGAVGYKSYVGPYREDRPGLICQDTSDMYRVLQKSAEVDRLVGFHSEDRCTIELLQSRLVDSGRVDFRAYAESRPEFTESLAAGPLLEIARETGGHLHLVHMSSPWAIRLACFYREHGTDVTVETCPHYLVFSEEDTARLGPYAQVAPPLRPPAAVRMLMNLVSDGSIDIIATDHAPGTPDEKVRGRKNIFQGGGGLPALEVVWPLMLNEVNRERITVEDLVSLMAERPAKMARIYPQKGCLLPGSDADMVLVDMNEVYQLSAADSYTRNRDSAAIFDGMQVRGRIKTVLQRGQVVARDGKLVLDQPIGARWVRPRS